MGWWRLELIKYLIKYRWVLFLCDLKLLRGELQGQFHLAYTECSLKCCEDVSIMRVIFNQKSIYSLHL